MAAQALRILKLFSEALPTTVLLLLNAGWAAADCGTTPSDSTFVPDGTSFPNYVVGVPPTSTIDGSLPSLAHTANISINRVVGPGVPIEFNPDGTLANWQQYVDNGVLSQYAYIQVGFVGEVEVDPPTTIGIYVNGYPLENVVNSSLYRPITGQLACVQIETRYLKFAQRPAPGQTPTPAVNTIGFSGDLYRQIFYDNSPGVPLGTLTFQAMAPVVFVHGWNAGPWVWGPKPAVSTICPVNPHNSNDGGQDFVQALFDAKVPFDCSITIPPPNFEHPRGGAAEQSTGPDPQQLRCAPREPGRAQQGRVVCAEIPSRQR